MAKKSGRKVYLRWAAGLVGCLVAALPWGCRPATRYKVASTLFDGVPPPDWVTPTRGPVRRRRVLAGAHGAIPPTPTPIAAATSPTPVLLPVEEASLHGWSEVAKLLPASITGGPDWVAALEKRMIAPRAAFEPGTEPAEPFDLEVGLDPGVPGMKVAFPHKAHTEWLTCESCHTAIFQMSAGADKIVMSEIFAGKWCGKCHGSVAFPPMHCARCHVEMRG